VKNHCPDRGLLLSHLKHLVAEMFGLDLLDPNQIANDEPLVGGSLCLDSLDVLELAICLEEEFGIAICGGRVPQRVFTSIASLADFINTGARTCPTGLLGAAKIGQWGGLRSATAASSPAWQPVFASGARLTF
jgi:acyl carrier protein